MQQIGEFCPAVSPSASLLLQIQLSQLELRVLDFTTGAHILVVARDKVLDLLFVLRLRRVRDREDAHVRVGRIRVVGQREADVAEVLRTFDGLALIDAMAVGHEQQPIEVEETLTARLMNGRNDGLTLARELLQ